MTEIAPDGTMYELTGQGDAPTVVFTPELGQFYAVFQDKQSGSHLIYYYGSAAGTPPSDMHFCALDDIPWGAIASDAERSMLTRYREEFRHADFGIDQGDNIYGTVHRIIPTPSFTP
jgi:hypothetical protein